MSDHPRRNWTRSKLFCVFIEFECFQILKCIIAKIEKWNPIFYGLVSSSKLSLSSRVHRHCQHTRNGELLIEFPLIAWCLDSKFFIYLERSAALKFNTLFARCDAVCLSSEWCAYIVFENDIKSLSQTVSNSKSTKHSPITQSNYWHEHRRWGSWGWSLKMMNVCMYVEILAQILVFQASSDSNFIIYSAKMFHNRSIELNQRGIWKGFFISPTLFQ